MTVWEFALVAIVGILSGTLSAQVTMWCVSKTERGKKNKILLAMRRDLEDFKNRKK
jgi:preprotein translocase subunit SecF